MIAKDYKTRAPTWEELEQSIRPDLCAAIRKVIVLTRIDKALEENDESRNEVKRLGSAGMWLYKGLDVKREADRLDDERVALHTLRRIEE